MIAHLDQNEIGLAVRMFLKTKGLAAVGSVYTVNYDHSLKVQSISMEVVPETQVESDTSRIDLDQSQGA